MEKNYLKTITPFILIGFMFAQVPLLLISINYEEQSNNIPNRQENLESTKNPLIEEPKTSISELKTITFSYSKSGSINIPFNIDVFNQYVHSNTRIDIDWKIVLPFDINYTYKDQYKKGEAHDLKVQLIIPEKEAYFRINTTTNFNMSWHITGVNDGSVSLVNYKWDFQYNFDTPLGAYNLDFLSYKFKIPVSIQGVPIGNFYIQVTPQIIASVIAQLQQNPNFCESLAMEWEKEGIKTLTLTAKNDSTSGWTTVTIGDFEYTISLGFEWAVGFEFVGPFTIIDKILEIMGYDLHWVLGTWPKIEIGSLHSADEINMNIYIVDSSETGADYNTAIGIDALNWWDNPQKIPFPNSDPGTNAWYYQFPVHKDWKYYFEVINCSQSKNISIYIYDESRTLIRSERFSGSATQVSFIANSEANYYLVLDPEDNTPMNAYVQFDNIKWPGIERDMAIEISYPFVGDYWFLTAENSSAWYKFYGQNGQIVSFWCYEYNDADNLDLELYYDTTLKTSSIGTFDNPENLTFNIDTTGYWYLRIKGSYIQGDKSDFWLDFG
ncbi:MAG: hypothetical protein ACP6IY_15935, partial [Promethearchaeia archaeon]